MNATRRLSSETHDAVMGVPPYEWRTRIAGAGLWYEPTGHLKPGGDERYARERSRELVDLDAKPRCWAGSAFDYVHYHVPRKVLDDIAADFAVDYLQLLLGAHLLQRYAR